MIPRFQVDQRRRLRLHAAILEQRVRVAPVGSVVCGLGWFGANVLSLVAQGIHPGSARPLLVKVDNASRLKKLLAEQLFENDVIKDALRKKW